MRGPEHRLARFGARLRRNHNGDIVTVDLGMQFCTEDFDLVHLKYLTRLQELILASCDQITDANVELENSTVETKPASN